MKIYKVLVVCFGLCALSCISSCSLDREPYNAVVVTGGLEEGDIEAMVRGSYARMKEEYFYKTIHQYGEYGGDNVALSGNTVDLLLNILRYERMPDNHYPRYLWQFVYNILVNVNIFIPMIEEFATTEPNRHMLGEMYFIRSLLYFHCCNIFGRPYLDPNGPDNNLGIPIKTEPDPDQTYFPPRATVRQVYDQIISDARLAAEYMKRSEHTIPKKSVEATQEAAWALLSRVYLYMGEYEIAGKYCDSVINSDRNFRLLEGEPYRTYPRQVPEDNTETIFAIRMTKDVDYERYHMDEYSVGAMYAQINDEGWGEMYPSESYLELLRQNPTDNRFGFIENQLAESGGMWMIYVEGNEANKTYVYRMNTVEAQPDGRYRITEGASSFTNPIVQQEMNAQGNIQHYVVTTSGTRYNVWIEPKCSIRDSYGQFPKRYIMKCSLQEGQAHLYSPVMFRLAEMYLTRAECRYHAGNYQGAIDDINVIRRRANIPERSLSQTSNPSMDILPWVLDERRLELAWEGHRKYDIFRYGQTLNRRYPGYHLSGAANTVFLDIEPTDLRIVELIPQSEINAYPGGPGVLEQNP